MNNANRSIGTIIYLAVPAILGAGFSWGAIAQLREYDTLSSRGRQVAALLVKSQTSSSPRSPGYLSILRYLGPDGKPIEVASHINVDQDTLRTGQDVMVVYDPDNPTHVRLTDEIAAGRGAGPWISAALCFAGMFWNCSALQQGQETKSEYQHSSLPTRFPLSPK
jgi:hypothetical protein